jgi:hypothetical protein
MASILERRHPQADEPRPPEKSAAQAKIVYSSAQEGLSWPPGGGQVVSLAEVGAEEEKV